MGRSELPPEGRRCPALLDLGIAFPDDRIEIALGSLGPIDQADRGVVVSERDRLEQSLDLPDGWLLLYQAQLARLERMAVDAGDATLPTRSGAVRGG